MEFIALSYNTVYALCQTNINEWECKNLAKYAQKTCPSNLRITTCRESEFPRTVNLRVNAKTLP